VLAAAGASALLLMTACSSGGTSSGGAPSEDGELQKVAICTGAQPDYAPLWVAEELGMWEDEFGIDLEIDVCATSPIAIAAILNDERQASNNSVTGVSTAVGQGIPAKVIFPTTYQPTEGNTGVIVPVDSDIQTFADLEGKTLGTITVQGLFHLGLADAMRNQGADPNKMKVVGSAPADLEALLKSGKVDAVMVQDAFFTQIMENLGDTVRDIGNPFAEVSWGENLVIGAMVASEKQLKDNPELYKKLRDGWARAIELAEENPDVVREVVAEYTGLAPDLLDRITWGEYTTEIPEESTMEMLETMLEFGFVKAIPEFSDIVWDGN
jgi:NitT/TauT family transport system substrate-binding protein